MNYLSVLAEKWFQPCYELRGCWTPHWIFYIFFLSSLYPSPLSLPSSAYEQRGVYTTHREIIDPWRNHWRIVRGWLIPRRWLPGQWPWVERKPLLLLVVSLLDLCIKTRVFCVLIQPPPFFPQKCVCINLFKQGFSVYLKFLGKILRFWIRHLSSWKEKSQNSVENFFLDGCFNCRLWFLAGGY